MTGSKPEKKPEPPKKPKVGRPSVYKPEYAEIAKKVCEVFGSIDVQLADVLGISLNTLYSWKLKHQEFLEATRAGKEAADSRVEASLLHKAVGYTYDAVKIVADAKTGAVVKIPYREHVPPDTAAIQFWLKNRRPEVWRDKHEVAHKLSPDNISADELRAQILADIAELGLVPANLALPPPGASEGVANRPRKTEH